MTTQLHDEGEEFVIKQIFESDIYSLPTSVTVGLYDDSTDTLSDSSSTSAITTGTGVTNSVTLDSSGFQTQTDGNTDWKGSNANTLSFDLSGVSSGSIDSWYIQATYDQDNDTSDETVLVATGDLSQSYTLSNVDTFDLNADGCGFSLD